MKEALKTKPEDSPKVVAFKDGEELKKTFIVGGEGVVEMGKALEDSFLLLLGVYYILNIQYPKCYSGVLGVLQKFYIKDSPYSLWKSTGHKMLIPRLVEAGQQMGQGGKEDSVA